jgi:hypothetical protein
LLHLVETVLEKETDVEILPTLFLAHPAALW